MSDWHAIEVQDVLKKLSSERQGLSQDEVARRRDQFGANRLTPPRRRGAVLRFLLQFHNVLIYVLLASASVTAWLAHWVDTGVIVGVVVINAVIGFIQEGKAEQAMEAIRRMLSPAASVLRQGRREVVPAEELVPGDIVLLQSGDRVPADLRLLSVKNLRIEEAALTGESEAVEKSIDPLQAPLADRRCMAYSSTLVVYGQGVGVVIAIADQTEIGRISSLLDDVQTLATPLLREMNVFGRWLTMVIMLLAVLTFLYGWGIHQLNIADMFLAAVSMAVAAIPEGLPAVMTITLALGVQRMARRNAIIRRLPAVESLGAVTVICTDKTGTLTCNEMTVQRVISANHVFEVSGAGYAPHGGFSLAGQEAAIPDEMVDLFRAGLLCNDARLREREGSWQIEGDPTEGALITLALKAGLDEVYEHESLPRTDIIPFESAHRFMATLHHDHAGHAFIFVKGAAEQVLDMCHQQRGLGEGMALNLPQWHAQISETGGLGQRVLALAMKVVDSEKRALGFDDMQAGFTLLGMVGITDPPREEAIEAVRECQRAGIRVKMITGDHAATALAIASKLNIGNGGVLIGDELDALDEAALSLRVQAVDVYARASPEHKLRLVSALQARGEIVAMTGDGVNDAPALKRADVGVAMGMKGTEVAKEAAEVVLVDDNFATIVDAVKAGRTVYDNIRKAIVFIIPSNGGEAGIVLIAILFGMTLPITPVQILWINMVTAVTLALALSFEKSEAGVMHRPPRPPGTPILSGFMIWRISFVSLLLAGGSITLFLWESARNVSIEESRTVVVNALVAGEIAYLFNCRYLLLAVRSWRDFTGNAYVLLSVAILALIQALFTYLPFMQRLFGVASLDVFAWLRILAFGVLLYFVVELEKALIRRWAKAGAGRDLPRD